MTECTLSVAHAGRDVAVTVIVVSYNTREMTCACLRSVYAQTRDVKVNVIVVDNASRDGSAQALKAEFPQAVVILNERNLGFAAANNQAMRLARGRYVLLLNSDTIILDKAIERCIQYADAQPDVGALGCRAEFPDGRFQSTYFRFSGITSLLGTALGLDNLLPQNRLRGRRYWGRVFDEPQDVDVVAGCFLLVRADVVAQVGMLDEDFFMYGEEAEWCWRITRAGWRVRYYPAARIVHYWSASSSPASATSIVAKRRGALLVLQKTRGPFHAWLGNIVMALGALIRLVFFGVIELGNCARGRGSFAPLRTRLRVLAFHCVGLVRTNWC